MELTLIEGKLIFTYYYSEYQQNDWVREKLREDKEVTFKRTLTFKEKDEFKINKKNNEKDEFDEISIYNIAEFDPISFVLAELKEDGYYRIRKRITNTRNQVYLYKDLEFNINYFIAETKISIFGQIDNLVEEDIFIGGDSDKAIPIEDFDKLIHNFPTTYEKKTYAEARIASIIKNYFETTKDAEGLYHNYLNKKISKTGKSLNKLFQNYELKKYSTILEKLEGMLVSENSYNENQWQNEILEIILLLYPKYIASFKSVFVQIDEKKRRFLDFMLVDYNGNIDVIEIKKPFKNSIMTSSLYRNNHIPHKDLIGTVMQLEKYIYHLNRWGKRGERELSKKYKDQLPEGLNIRITNPKGFIIMGREDNLTNEQKSDFEIVKRKYTNVIDIITYDDLLERLKFTVSQIKQR
ncbi:Shedu immune nuclease family protein [uncultured Winogradskyella sp.]|uniref:Shedu immune nuclease family protein n=1 Tax=uncultured Winogradskyella sp. TaxID=395353 RepID=UPI00261EF542|nr:Shedu immune nuclease family protein [uncultured Winogradskyella sp.]